jgi:sulfur relay (sulfurtransferase) DsrC/TusE family protein
MKKKTNKERFIGLRITEQEYELINLLRYHYEEEGIKYNMSNAIRTFIIHCTKQLQ